MTDGQMEAIAVSQSPFFKKKHEDKYSRYNILLFKDYCNNFELASKPKYK